MVDADEEDEEDAQIPSSQGSTAQRTPREGRKEKDLNAFLNSMDKYAPIVRHWCGTLAYSRYPTQSQITTYHSLDSSVLIKECTFHICLSVGAT